MMNIALVVFLAGTRVLTLGEALQMAQKDQPTVHQAHANTEAAMARVGEARAPLLAADQRQRQLHPRHQQHVELLVALHAGGLQRRQHRRRPGGDGAAVALQLRQAQPRHHRVADAVGRLRAAGALAAEPGVLRGVADTERATRLSVALNVRTYYFAARANKALVQVARDTLANQQKHLEQVQGFVKVGTQPEIELAQQRTAVANAQVQVINAENNYEVAKAQLNQAIGIERDTAYDVQDESTPPIEGEDLGTDPLLAEALKARPDYLSLGKQVEAQQLAVWAAKTAYGPNLTASTSLSDQGSLDSVQTAFGQMFPNALAWNWNFNLTLNWQLFSGGLTWYTVKEQKANLDGIEAQRDLLRQQVRLGVEQARLAVRAAKAALGAADEAELNAREQLRLAEGRYQAGVGSIIELGDAQVAATTAEAQKVQADYNVSTARAQLLNALGRF